MKARILIKVGEIALKKGNRNFFEKKLRNNIKKVMPFPVTLDQKYGRLFLDCEEQDREECLRLLSYVTGIVGYAPVYETDKTKEAVLNAAVRVAEESMANQCGYSFKVKSRRIDKSLPFRSQDIAVEAGGAVLERFPDLQVKMKDPDWTVSVELREKAYIYGTERKGPGGLPAGCAGQGLLLLSGGIDSPVAGYLMAKRGLNLTACHFHTPPYTSEESLEKVRDLAQKLAVWNIGLRYYEIPFTECQLLINKSVPKDKTTLHSRAAMMEIASKLALREHCECLITGEALSQVASQTLQSLRYTDSVTELPVFRPLIGWDKEEIIEISRERDFFTISTLPFDDCCALFSPAHPSVHPDFLQTQKEHSEIPNLSETLTKALEEAVIHHFGVSRT